MCNIKYTWKEPGAPTALHEGGVWEEGGMTRGGVTSVSFKVVFYGTTSNNRWLSLSPSVPTLFIVQSQLDCNWSFFSFMGLSLPIYTLHHCSLKLHVTNVSIRQVPERLSFSTSFREVWCGKVSQLTSVKQVHIKNTPTRAQWWLENWFHMINQRVHTSLQLKYCGTRICQSFHSWYVMGPKKPHWTKYIYFF